MANENPDDAIIQIADALRNKYGTAQEFAVEYSSFETDWGIPPGLTATYIDQAAADLGYEVTRKGAARASLRKKSPFAIV